MLMRMRDADGPTLLTSIASVLTGLRQCASRCDTMRTPSQRLPQGRPGHRLWLWTRGTNHHAWHSEPVFLFLPDLFRRALPRQARSLCLTRMSHDACKLLFVAF